MYKIFSLFPGHSPVSRRILAITGLFLLTITGLLFFTVSTLQHQKIDSTIIDLAGRQRMLNQRYMKETLLLSHSDQATISSTRNLLLNTIEALMNGGSAVVNQETGQTIVLPPAPTKEILQVLRKQQLLINQFINKADMFLQRSQLGSRGETTLGELLELNRQVHQVANEAVKLFDAHSSS